MLQHRLPLLRGESLVSLEIFPNGWEGRFHDRRSEDSGQERGGQQLHSYTEDAGSEAWAVNFILRCILLQCPTLRYEFHKKMSGFDPELCESECGGQGKMFELVAQVF